MSRVFLANKLMLRSLFFTLCLTFVLYHGVAKTPDVSFVDFRLISINSLQTLNRIASEYQSYSEEQKRQVPPYYETISQALGGGDVDAAMDLAYMFRGYNTVTIPRHDVSLALLNPHVSQEKVQALATFFENRSVSNALQVIRAADSPISLSVGYMCLAEAQYAQGDIPKALMATVLSLAYNFSEHREEQALLYLTGSKNSQLSLKGDKGEVIQRLVDKMRRMLNPHEFHRYFGFITTLNMLPEFPYSPELLSHADTEPLHLCIGFDGNYSYHGAVTILSAMLSANPHSRYVFHIPEDATGKTPIPDKHKEKLLAMAELFPANKFQIVFEAYSEDFLPEALMGHTYKYWPRGVLFKLYIPEFYADLSRILWLDSDLIVRSDLQHYYHENLGENWMMAVRDLDALSHLSRLGMNEEDAYINAGVLLYDIEKLRNKGSLIQDYVVAHSEEPDFFKFPEQDVFAVAYRGHIKENSYQHWLDKKFFFQSAEWNWFYMPHHVLVDWDKVHDHYAKVIHMAAYSKKPWNRKYSSLLWSLFPRANDGVQNMYWSLRDMGPWPTKITK